MHYFSTLFGKELYLFWTDLLSIISSPSAVSQARRVSCLKWFLTVYNLQSI